MSRRAPLQAATTGPGSDSPAKQGWQLGLDDQATHSIDVDFLANPRMRAYLARLPLVLDADDEEHVLVFRRTLELAMSQGRWAGQMGSLS